MKNKVAIMSLAAIITALCLFYLSFTFVSNSYQDKAIEFATQADGTVDSYKKQKFFDSLRNTPVYLGFTLKEVKDNELHLGLDLQGGMHVVLEVSPVEIIKVLAGNSSNPNFVNALKNSIERQKGSQAKLTTLFFEEYEKLAGQNKLADVFAIASNRGRIDFKTPDTEIKKIIETEVEDAIDRAYNIIKTRIDKFGVTQPNVQRMPGTSRIQIELPGVDDPQRVRKLLQGVAKLEFWEVWNGNDYFPYLQKANEVAARKIKTDGKDASKKTDLSDLVANDSLQITDADSTKTDSTKVESNEFASVTTDSAKLAQQSIDSANAKNQVSPLFSKLVQVSQTRLDLVYESADTAQINSILADKAVKSVLPSNLTFMWGVKPMFEEKGKSFFQLFPIKKNKRGEAPLTGEVIIDARQGFDEQGRPDISMQMNPKGARDWKKLTGQNVGNQVAIVLDNYVYSAPVVQSEIGGGNSSITGSFTIEEAKDLANVLKAGKLPAPTTIVEEAVVGPSLGKEAIFQGLQSIVGGLALVVLFMIVYYASSGVVANVALLINIFFIVGILAQLNASLTLPGIAGIVLTIGMAVDANVLIFERIREEIRKGLGKFEAVKEGYDRAFWSIFDSNLTTLLVAFFLYSFGTGPIKGFAITLIIGIICSFFTAVYISKVIVFQLVEKTGNQSKLNFSASFNEDALTNTNYNFLAKRHLAYLFSAVLIAIGMIVIAAKGMNLGVDFKGGRTYVVEFAEQVVPSDIKVKLAANFPNSGIEVKSYDTPNKVKVTTTFMIEDESDKADEAVKAALEKGLGEYASLKPTVLSSSKVGATVADDIQKSAGWSVLASLIAIFLYILVRFRRYQFGLGAIVALFHDVLMVFSLYAIAGVLGMNLEVDQVFVAAVLTIIGYSINDTVVVFDRVREFMGNSEDDASLLATINESINSTLSRTLITSGTTFLVVIILFLFGGEVLRGFSFAMLIGLVFGTYSSIFIATPFVVDTMGWAKNATVEEKNTKNA